MEFILEYLKYLVQTTRKLIDASRIPENDRPLSFLDNDELLRITEELENFITTGTDRITFRINENANNIPRTYNALRAIRLLFNHDDNNQ